MLGCTKKIAYKCIGMCSATTQGDERASPTLVMQAEAVKDESFGAPDSDFDKKVHEALIIIDHLESSKRPFVLTGLAVSLWLAHTRSGA